MSKSLFKKLANDPTIDDTLKRECIQHMTFLEEQVNALIRENHNLCYHIKDLQNDLDATFSIAHEKDDEIDSLKEQLASYILLKSQET